MKKTKRDKRLHLSTVRMLLISLAIMVFAFNIAFTSAWASHMDLVESTASTDVFKTLDLETLDGDRFTSENLKDARITFFNVWGTTCAPCILEMPELEELSHSYPEGELQIVGMLDDSLNSQGEQIESNLEQARKLCEKSGVTYPTLILDENTYAFMSSAIAGTPTTFFIDQNGDIILIVTGSNGLDEWKAYVDEALSKVSQ